MTATLIKKRDLKTAAIHTSWQPLIQQALATVDADYLDDICSHSDWLPGAENIFNAFSLPLKDTRYILLGESPYPRRESANGYAFWDGKVDELWSATGLSKPVNRATSLRHITKMLLIAEGVLSKDDASQPPIAAIDKQFFVRTIDELFKNFLKHGFLLLNASLVLSEKNVRHDAKLWFPFIKKLLEQLATLDHQVELVLFGKIAEKINLIEAAQAFPQLIAEHPYNISFIQNDKVINFFQPLHLLKK